MTDPLRTALAEMVLDVGRQARQLHHDLDIARKPDGSLVTQLDRDVERALAKRVRARFPDASVVGEEGTDRTGSGRCFYIDPIDGTESMVRGLAYWGPTITVVDNGRLAAGALHLPMLGTVYSASRVDGAFQDAHPLRLRESPTDERCILFGPSRFHLLPGRAWPGKVRSLGSMAAHLALVAAGVGDVAFVPRWSMWDVGAGILMIEQAGGVILGLDGEPFDPVTHAGLPFVAGAPRPSRRLVDGIVGARE